MANLNLPEMCFLLWFKKLCLISQSMKVIDVNKIQNHEEGFMREFLKLVPRTKTVITLITIQ